MKRKLLFASLECLSVIVSTAIGYGHEAANVLSRPIVLIIKLGISEDGTITAEWKEAIRDRHSAEMLSHIAARPSRFSEDESLWAELIKGKATTWPALIDSLCIPFEAIAPPDTIVILLGSLGGADAFTHSYATICFDLNQLQNQYGTASASVNSNRIDRFFAHEFTHLLHKAWRREKGLEFKSPFDYALWECLTEGLGNYRSLTDKWLLQSGKLTTYAQAVLERLQAMFVERILALQHASEKEAAALLEGLSSGAFERKWGALTVALWLAQEAKGDDRHLRKWVEAGPSGV